MWYDQGVGTSYSQTKNIADGITGGGIDKNIKDAYSFYIYNFRPGDEIFLFGFSRGAYTARSLAGFIRNCGILKPEYVHLLDRAYELYRNRNEYTAPDSDMMRGFRSQYAYETDIQFIGVWDTVGALGIPLPSYKMYNKLRYQFHDVQISSSIKYAYHALAIDEKRKLFAPAIMEQSSDIAPGKQVVEQRWFAGVHSNVGGGYEDTGLSDIALQWLIEKSIGVGLCFGDDYKQYIQANYAGELRNSFTPKYWLFGKVHRAIDLKDPKKYMVIDESVQERMKDTKLRYKPKNL